MNTGRGKETMNPSHNNSYVMPACSECRRRKLGCTKELPSCKECRRLGAACIYEAREKPGLKTGAVENLNRRVDKIEKLLEQVQQQTQPGLSVRDYSSAETSTAWIHNGNAQTLRAIPDLFHMFESLEREMREFRNLNHDPALDSPASSSCRSLISPSGTSLGNSAPNTNLRTDFKHSSGPKLKRKRSSPNPGEKLDWGELLLGLDSEVLAAHENLSTSNLLDAIVEVYFSQVHPWLPILHEITFRQRVLGGIYDTNLEAILRAIIYAALRFVIRIDTLLGLSSILQLTRSSRDWVVLHALNSLSVENLQALLIVAFIDVGNGEGTIAWSIVGSLTRTVEYLQLSVESDESYEKPLLKPRTQLSPSKDWTEMETRRRVFWNVFNLDRLCSTMTGWNTSLTSDDVHRRLPVDGFLWRKQQPVVAPFFGIWDKSAGRIGNSIKLLPASPNEDLQSPRPMAGLGQNSNDEGISALGALAYRIEATESMSRVTTYFLQQKVNLHDERQISRWLTRFKELDLRLVQWKMFLPQKWKDTNLSRKGTEVIMDPNLTLAHITHNASMILLHQLIAYPPSDWEWGGRLPSRCSAETCKTAALETLSITENYLKSPTRSKIVNSEFDFCVFVAARVLLVHWRYTKDGSLHPGFLQLVESLDALSNRWEGSLKMCATNTSNLAFKYATLLRCMHERCINDPDFQIDVLAYTNELENSRSKVSPTSVTVREEGQYHEEANFAEIGCGRSIKKRTIHQAQHFQNMMEPGEQTQRRWRANLPKNTTELVASPFAIQHTQTPLNASSIISGLPGNEEQYGMAYRVAPSTAAEHGILMDDFSSISQMFLDDQQFLDRDRVISYNEGMFTADTGWWG